MKKLSLFATIVAAAALLAGAAIAQDFDPIADAEYIGYPDTDTAFAGRLAPMTPGPHSDAEWDEVAWGPGDRTVLVAATFDPFTDVEFLDTTGYGVPQTMVAAACSDHCSAKCGSDCSAHCGSACVKN